MSGDPRNNETLGSLCFYAPHLNHKKKSRSRTRSGPTTEKAGSSITRGGLESKSPMKINNHSKQWIQHKDPELNGTNKEPSGRRSGISHSQAIKTRLGRTSLQMRSF